LVERGYGKPAMQVAAQSENDGSEQKEFRTVEEIRLFLLERELHPVSFFADRCKQKVGTGFDFHNCNAEAGAVSFALPLPAGADVIGSRSAATSGLAVHANAQYRYEPVR
jgi:hypothetical protein